MHKTSYGNTQSGYSLLELTVVVALLAMLTSISFPNIIKWIKLSRIDSVKTLLNSAASDCLQSIRSGKEPTGSSPSADLISNDNLSPYGYNILQTDNKCSSFIIKPTKEGEDFLYMMGFKISGNGDILKIAIPANDSGSLSSCKNWAGTNCGVSPEQQAIWDAIAKIEKDKKACNDNFYAWLQKPSSGSFNRWDEATKSCTLETWAFEGSIQKDEAAVKTARAAKVGVACTAKLKAKETEKFDGLFADPECGTTYFLSGKDLLTDSQTTYDARKEEERQMRCTAALGAWKNSSTNGAFAESGCTTMWKCDKTIYTTQADYDSSSCGCTWTTEQYVSGMTQERYITGYNRIQIGCNARNRYGTCIAPIYGNGDPIYGTRDVPAYSTRSVCKKN